MTLHEQQGLPGLPLCAILSGGGRLVLSRSVLLVHPWRYYVCVRTGIVCARDSTLIREHYAGEMRNWFTPGLFADCDVAVENQVSLAYQIRPICFKLGIADIMLLSCQLLNYRARLTLHEILAGANVSLSTPKVAATTSDSATEAQLAIDGVAAYLISAGVGLWPGTKTRIVVSSDDRQSRYDIDLGFGDSFSIQSVG